MKILFIILLLTSVVLFVSVGGVSAQISHASCGALGRMNAQFSPYGVTGDFTSTMATSGPGVIPQINEAAMEVFCVLK